MYRPSFAFYCAFLLLIISPTKNEEYEENFTNDEGNSTMRYDELDTNSIRNQGNETALMDDNFRENSVKNESETNFMLHETNETSNENDDDEMLCKMCNNSCVKRCCTLLIDNCKGRKLLYFVDNYVNITLEDLMDYSCEEYNIPFDIMNNENTMIFDNSSLNLSRHDRFISLMSNCFRISACHKSAKVCQAIVDQIKESRYKYLHIVAAFLIISLLCLLMTFIVYSICPELQNTHGYALRSYVVSLFVVYIIFLIDEEDLFEETKPVCIAESLLYYFCYLAGLLWQNVICFDILRLFGGFHMLRKNIIEEEQSKKKRFLISSIYVWGIASIYIIICALMNFVSNVPEDIRPNICSNLKFGFAPDAVVAYFDVLIIIIIVCNISFFIFTMSNIVYVTKRNDRFLKNAESNRNIDDKQRFMIYLKLFVLMDINTTLKWTLGMIFQSFGQDLPFYVPFIMDMMESLQGIIIFIVFVCKKKIIRLLLKRFDCENYYLYGKISTSEICHTTASRTSSTTVTTQL